MQSGPAAQPQIDTARPVLTAELMEETGLDARVLRELVSRFYDRARADARLGPIFSAHVRDWPAHLDLMVDFWSSVLLATGRYHGSPAPIHARLPIGAADYARWLALFEDTTREVCPPAGAARAIDRAGRIARALLQASTAHTPLSDPDPSHRGAAMQSPDISDPVALIAHIETRYHARHREQLPALAQLAEKVEAVHAGQPGVPAGLAELLRRMIGAMEVHMKKEELILFPALRAGGGAGVGTPIAVMRADHDDHATEIAAIRSLTGGLALPEGACRSWTALYDGLAEFIADLEEHIRLENDVLFPQFETQ